MIQLCQIYVTLSVLLDIYMVSNYLCKRILNETLFCCLGVIVQAPKLRTIFNNYLCILIKAVMLLV